MFWGSSAPPPLLKVCAVNLLSFGQVVVSLKFSCYVWHWPLGGWYNSASALEQMQCEKVGRQSNGHDMFMRLLRPWMSDQSKLDD